MVRRKGNFTEKTKLELSRRAGTQCSYCHKLTSGPSETEEKSQNIGEAAHIIGVGRESARFDGSKTEDELKHITNGIWFCKLYS